MHPNPPIVRIKTSYSKRTQLQVISLSVLYLFISLAVVFFLPRSTGRLFSKHPDVGKSCQICNAHYKNFLRRTDKIASFGRKQSVNRERDIQLFSATAEPEIAIGQSTEFLSHLKLKSAQRSQSAYLLNCCWRI